MKTKVLLDIDGVIADFYAGFARHLNEYLNTNLDISTEPNEYSLHKWGHGLPNNLIDAEIPKWIMQGGYEHMPIYDGAKKFVHKLMDKYDVYVVTARVGDFRVSLPEEVINATKEDTSKWFKKYGIPTDKLIFEHEKIKFCKDNGIKIIIEDKLSTIVDGAKKDLRAILMDRGWNKNGRAWYGEYLNRNHPNIYVAHEYKDILDTLDILARELTYA